MHELELFKLDNLHTFILRQPWWLAKNAHQPIFPYYIIESSAIPLAHNSIFICPNTFKFGTETRYIALKTTQELEEVDHNLHNNLF